MIFGKTKLELKVGIFVFVGLVILAIFILSIGGFKTWASGYEVDFMFNFVNGIKMGAPVRFAGLDTGEVKKIKFIFIPGEQKTRVKVTCWVKRDVQIPIDSTIWVNTLGLLGEKYIEIMPGKNYGQILAPNQAIDGIDPIPMHEVVRLAKSIIENINLSLEKIRNKEGTLGKLIYEDTIYNELEAFVTDIRKNPWKLFIKTKEKK
jgi:phospholipid/cholesterol/gamma-HCH transport system substrate-binding protein